MPAAMALAPCAERALALEGGVAATCYGSGLAAMDAVLDLLPANKPT